MIELFFSALITVYPDYLFRRYGQGKRLGHEITLFTVWYELRWGITACVILAITLIAVIFYFHPTATNVTSLFRTVSILSERPGRVAEVYVQDNETVIVGQPIFRLDTSRQEAAAETAERRIAEIDALLQLTQTEQAAAEARVVAAAANLVQAEADLRRREDIAARNPSVVTEQELEQLSTALTARRSERDAANAGLEATRLQYTSVLPAQRASAMAILAEATTEIANSTVFAGVDGTVKQFKLRVGDVVNPILRPAGILVPADSGRQRFQAGFGQMAAQILQLGMLVEITCASEALTVFPMRVIEIQDAIASGQLRPTDQLIDIRDRAQPGTILATLEPIFPGHTTGVTPGSACLGVAYSDHGPEIENGDIGGLHATLLRLVDGMGIANAFVLRIQALVLPIQVLVFSR